MEDGRTKLEHQLKDLDELVGTTFPRRIYDRFSSRFDLDRITECGFSHTGKLRISAVYVSQEPVKLLYNTSRLADIFKEKLDKKLMSDPPFVKGGIDHADLDLVKGIESATISGPAYANKTDDTYYRINFVIENGGRGSSFYILSEGTRKSLSEFYSLCHAGI